MSILPLIDTISYNVAYVVAIGATAIAITVGVSSAVRTIHKSTSGPITLRRKGALKSVTLPAHYSERAVRDLLDLVA